MVFPIVMTVIAIGAAIAWLAYEKGKQQSDSRTNPMTACLTMLKDDLNDLKTQKAVYDTQASRLQSNSDLCLAQVNGLIKSNQLLILDAEKLLINAKQANQQSFDLVNRAVDFQQLMDRLYTRLQPGQAQIQGAPAQPLEPLPGDVKQHFSKDRESMNLLENQTHIVEHEISELIQQLHQHQRATWEILASIEQQAHQAKLSGESLREYSKALGRADDLLSHVDARFQAQ